jgi:hypothetical protein
VVASVGHDAARLVLVALEKVGPTDPKACRRFRRKAVQILRFAPCLADVRAEAIRGMERSCGACGGCKGVRGI